jgi:hypothetical protein
MYANFDRYTGQQVGGTFSSFAAAQAARRSFRLQTLVFIRGAWEDAAL